ncbi:MAG: hypothetical protein AAF597_09035, partial [Bacteroidota bacterium]
MSSLITDTIREILMEEQQVCLPGVGTLRLTPQPAVVSPIEGKASPPSNRASFNSNLVLDDGRILRSLTEIPVLTSAEAKALLDEFLKNITDNLDAGRSVTLDGIGRLFKHFDGEVRFTAGGENFSKDSFGLPDVDLKPIARTEKTSAKPADPLLASTTALDPLANPGTRVGSASSSAGNKPKSKWEEIIYHPDLKQILWYLVAALASIAILALGYLAIQTIIRNYADEPAARVADEPIIIEEPPARRPLPPVDADRVTPDDPPRLNEARQQSTAAQPAPFEQPQASEPAPATPSTASEPTTPPPPATSTQAPGNTSSGYSSARIAIGLYGSRANV